MNRLARELPRSPALIAAVAVFGIGAAGLLLPTLTRVPGFTHALAVNMLVGTVGLWISVVVGRSRRRRLERETHEGARPPLTGKQGALVLGVPATTSLILLVALCLLSIGMALLNGLRVGLCEVRSVLPFYLVLPMASAPLVAVAGTSIAWCTRRSAGAAALVVVTLLTSAAFTAWPILTGPPTFAFNHLLGHVPGPIYDERFSIDSALIWWRASSISWTLVLLATSALFLSETRTRIGRRPFFRRRGAVLLLGLSLSTLGLLTAKRSELGFHQTNRSVAEALGGEVRTDHFVIHYPAERSAEWVEKVVRDHEYQYEVVRDWLELDAGNGGVVRSYVFRSAAEKGRLTGAGRTSVAKPWLRSMYIHDRPYPHPVLRHELVHVMASSFGSFPFRASSRHPLSMNAGLVEGLAVAADWPADDLSVHGWARAMREIGVAPNVRSLFSAGGFFSQSSTRAYTLAGSFVRWLAETEGLDAVKTAYRRGALSAVGDPEALFSAWEAFLDADPVDEAAHRLAEHRFRRPSILRRPCAFDVAAARGRARRALGARRHEEALRWFERASELEPNDPWHLKGILDSHLARGNGGVAKEVAEAILDHPKADSRLRSEVLMALGDLAWRQEEIERAIDSYGKIELPDTSSTTRMATVKIWAASEPRISSQLRPFLLGELRREVAVLILSELLDELPDDPLPPYLLGRQLYNVGVYSFALPYLERADELGLTDRGGLRLENLRLIARARYEQGADLEAAARDWERIATDPFAGDGARVLALDWARRARFALNGNDRE